MWKWMTSFEEKTGGDVLAIAHNGNLSNGRMFPTVEAFGKELPGTRMTIQERAFTSPSWNKPRPVFLLSPSSK